jgi:hypothetical protein
VLERRQIIMMSVFRALVHVEMIICSQLSVANSAGECPGLTSVRHSLLLVRQLALTLGEMPEMLDKSKDEGSISPQQEGSSNGDKI